MIYVLTVHWRSHAWVDVQLDYLRRHLTEPYRVLACCEGLPPQYERKFDTVLPAVGAHAGKLNLLASEALRLADADDLIIFLDGDAFPIRDPLPSVRRWLEESDFVAVRRSEIRYPQPHPSFFVSSANTWLRIGGDWSPAYAWSNPWYPAVDRRPLITDVGGNLLFKVETLGLRWWPLERTNIHNPHPYFYGVYGDLIYHHGGGFSHAALGLTDLGDSPFRRVQLRSKSRFVRSLLSRAHKRWARRRQKKIARMSLALYEEMQINPFFYKRLTENTDRN